MDDKFVTMDDITKRFKSDKRAKSRNVLLKGEEGVSTERLVALRDEIIKLSGSPYVRIQTVRHTTVTVAK